MDIHGIRKAIRFGLIYGATPQTLARKLVLPQDLVDYLARSENKKIEQRRVRVQRFNTVIQANFAELEMKLFAQRFPLSSSDVIVEENLFSL